MRLPDRNGPARTSERCRSEAGRSNGMASRPKVTLAQRTAFASGNHDGSRRLQELDPALGRVREINQAVAHEQAIRAMNGDSEPQADPHRSAGMVERLLAGITETGTLEARASVLSEVLSRSANEAKLVERATMITSRGMNALASQKRRKSHHATGPTKPGTGDDQRCPCPNGVVHAELHASNSVGRVVMERGLETLRASLESRGLSVERLSVQAGDRVVRITEHAFRIEHAE